MSDELDAGVDEEAGGAAGEDTGVEEQESVSSADSEDDTDWKAEAERLEAELGQTAEERDNYKIALDQKRQLRKERQKAEESDNDDTRPATVADVARIVDSKEAAKSVDAVLADLVKDPNKRAVVKLNYENRVRQTGTSDAAIRADIDTAIDVTEAKKLRKTNSELARANREGRTTPMNGSSSDRDTVTKDHKFSPDQVKDLTDRAKRMSVDPAKFISQAWKNQQK